MAVIRRLLLPFARRFVAGETMDAAAAHARTLDEAGIVPYIDLLGEHVAEESTVAAARDEYLDLLDEAGIEAGLSVKPTQLGLAIDRELCLKTIAALLERAGESGRYVWIDMESSDYTDATLELYRELAAEHDNVGVCIQAYLKRSREDVADLVDAGADIRLVKGAYDEPGDVAYQEKERVDENFRALPDVLFASDAYFAVATHDEALVDHARERAGKSGRGQDEFEFQFLMGVKDDLERELAADGYRVAEYVPYGPGWLPYYWRRVRERTENLFVAPRAVAPW